MRYKVIYVVATKDKVVLDFEITNNMPSHVELIPLLKRIKERIPEAQINKIVSDEDNAIIGAVRVVFPKTPHAFCVFHQMKTVTKKFADEFKQKEDIPIRDMEVYETANELIAAENAIESTILYRRIMDIAKNSDLSEASRKVIKYINKIFVNNLNLLKMGFIPETNNTMEEIFSLINDFVNQTRSLKRDWSAKKFFNNLFAALNKRSFNTGKWRGYSPVERAKILHV
jgi:transposase-like protein